MLWTIGNTFSVLYRWFRAAVLPLDRKLETELFHCEKVRSMWQPVPSRLQPCEILPGVHRCHKAETCRREQTLGYGEQPEKFRPEPGLHCKGG